MTDTYAEAMGAPTETDEDDRTVTIGRRLPAKDAAEMKHPLPVNGVCKTRKSVVSEPYLFLQVLNQTTCTQGVNNVLIGV